MNNNSDPIKSDQISGGQKNILNELSELLGEEWVSNNPSVLANYQGAYEGAREKKSPEIVVFPSSGEDVRQIVGIVNKYAVPLLSMTAFFDHTVSSVAKEHGGVLMDLRRMDIVGG